MRSPRSIEQRVSGKAAFLRCVLASVRRNTADSVRRIERELCFFDLSLWVMANCFSTRGYSKVAAKDVEEE